jgi:hypothetical protein
MHQLLNPSDVLLGLVQALEYTYRPDLIPIGKGSPDQQQLTRLFFQAPQSTPWFSLARMTVINLGSIVHRPTVVCLSFDQINWYHMTNRHTYQWHMKQTATSQLSSRLTNSLDQRFAIDSSSQLARHFRRGLRQQGKYIPSWV